MWYNAIREWEWLFATPPNMPRIWCSSAFAGWKFIIDQPTSCFATCFYELKILLMLMNIWLKIFYFCRFAVEWLRLLIIKVGKKSAGGRLEVAGGFKSRLEKMISLWAFFLAHFLVKSVRPCGRWISIKITIDFNGNCCKKNVRNGFFMWLDLQHYLFIGRTLKFYESSNKQL